MEVSLQTRNFVRHVVKCCQCSSMYVRCKYGKSCSTLAALGTLSPQIPAFGSCDHRHYQLPPRWAIPKSPVTLSPVRGGRICWQKKRTWIFFLPDPSGRGNLIGNEWGPFMEEREKKSCTSYFCLGRPLSPSLSRCSRPALRSRKGTFFPKGGHPLSGVLLGVHSPRQRVVGLYIPYVSRALFPAPHDMGQASSIGEYCLICLCCIP